MACMLMLRHWAVPAYGKRHHALLMRKDCELSGKGIWSLLCIAFPILLSTSIHTSVIRRLVISCYGCNLWFQVRHCLTVWWEFVNYCLQYLQSYIGLQSDSSSLGKDVAVHFVSGGLSGITAASVTYPLDLVRTRLAAQVLPPEWGNKSFFF